MDAVNFSETSMSFYSVTLCQNPVLFIVTVMKSWNPTKRRYCPELWLSRNMRWIYHNWEPAGEKLCKRKRKLLVPNWVCSPHRAQGSWEINLLRTCNPLCTLSSWRSRYIGFSKPEPPHPDRAVQTARRSIGLSNTSFRIRHGSHIFVSKTGHFHFLLINWDIW
jgi:hypothetical protein